MRPLLAALLVLATFTVAQAQEFPDTPPAGVGGYPGASLDYNPEPPGTYVLGCTNCLGPSADRMTDCYELITQRGGCAEMATQEASFQATLAAPPPTLTLQQCDWWLLRYAFVPSSCEGFATEVAVEKANWHATVQAAHAPYETEVAESGETGYCYSERRAGFVGVGCATPTLEEDN